MQPKNSRGNFQIKLRQVKHIEKLRVPVKRENDPGAQTDAH